MIGAILGGVASGLFGMMGARSSARAQERSGDKQLALQSRMFNTQRQDFAPYRTSGGNALNAYMSELGLGARPAGYGGFTASPGYQFRLGEGTRAIEGASAAMGNSLSGNTLRDLTSFGQGIASEEYGTHLARLRDMAGVGQASAAGSAAAASNFATGGSNALANIGNAQASGYMGMANAAQSGINNGLGIWAYQNVMNPPVTPNASSYGIRLPGRLLGSLR